MGPKMGQTCSFQGKSVQEPIFYPPLVCEYGSSGMKLSTPPACYQPSARLRRDTLGRLRRAS
eukprot:4426349-Amphidinium_carterae.1